MSGYGSIGAAALLAATAGLGGCISTSTYGTGQAPEAAIIREMTGGLAGAEREKIEYQPRAPLVMPASAAQLPTPVETAAAADPQWPVDPDQNVAGPDLVDEEARGEITPEEYRRLKPLSGVASAPARQRSWQEENQPAYDLVNNKKQAETFKAALDEQAGVGSTERRFLTDPPQTIRAPAPTAQTEFEEIETKRSGGWTRWLFGGG